MNAFVLPPVPVLTFDRNVGLGRRVANQLSSGVLLAHAVADGLLTAAEAAQPSPHRLEVLHRRLSREWLARAARRRLALRDVFDGVARVGTEDGERIVQHAVALTIFDLRAEIGRARRAKKAAYQAKRAERLRLS